MRKHKRLGNWPADINTRRMRTHSFVFGTILLVVGSVCGAPAPIALRDATIGDVKLHYMTAGHGPTVILLHGFAET